MGKHTFVLVKIPMPMTMKGGNRLFLCKFHVSMRQIDQLFRPSLGKNERLMMEKTNAYDACDKLSKSLIN